jgi:glyoxylase-like metal-dependent hydrolase (beta-lactamase superfamily II)
MLVVPGFHIAEMTRSGRAYLIVDGTVCVLIDTGAPDGTLGAGQLIESAHRKAFEVRLILLTHAHAGHAGNAAGLRNLTGAPLACSRSDAAALAEPVRPERHGVLGHLRHQDLVEPVHADRILEPGEHIDMAGGIDIVAAPGHSQGSLAFHLLGPDALCFGDAASLDHGRLVPPPARHCADPAAALESAERLDALSARILAPGHGYPSIAGRMPKKVR